MHVGKARREDFVREENSWILFKKEEVEVKDGDGEHGEEVEGMKKKHEEETMRE